MDRSSTTFDLSVVAGDHTITIMAKDVHGNTSLPISYTWRVDTQAPALLSGGEPTVLDIPGS